MPFLFKYEKLTYRNIYVYMSGSCESQAAFENLEDQ